MAESITEGTLKTWTKKVGDFVEADEEVATIETDKIDVSVNAPKSGKIVEILFNEEDTVTVGADLFKIEPGEGGAAQATEAPKEESAPKPKEEESKPQPAAETAKPEPPKETKAAPAPEAKKEEKKPAPAPAPPAAAAKPAAGSRGETRIKMSRMRMRIAERLKESQNAAASLTTFNEIDMTELMALRSSNKDQILKNTGIKLGFMSAFAKASCLALQEIKAANASIEGDEIVYRCAFMIETMGTPLETHKPVHVRASRDYVDLSVAVATPKGLVTPVVRNCEGMEMLQIEQEIANLGKKARDGKLTLEDMAGGSFTISNGGVFGSLYGTPIINLPQSAVLGMHAIKEKPYVVNGKIEI
ncbi:2-oxoglutarate dehydrogenase complex E2 component, partial [Tulasnella sp. 417]